MLLTTERYCFAQKFCLQNQDIQLKFSEGIYLKQQREKAEEGQVTYISLCPNSSSLFLIPKANLWTSLLKGMVSSVNDSSTCKQMQVFLMPISNQVLKLCLAPASSIFLFLKTCIQRAICFRFALWAIEIPMPRYFNKILKVVASKHSQHMEKCQKLLIKPNRRTLTPDNSFLKIISPLQLDACMWVEEKTGQVHRR